MQSYFKVLLSVDISLNKNELGVLESSGLHDSQFGLMTKVVVEAVTFSYS